MDSFNSQRDITVLKEPRGFLRIMQLALAILAFSLTVGYSVSTKFSIECTEPKKHTVLHTVKFQYPFNIHEDSTVDFPLCSNSSTAHPKKAFFGNYAHHSQFFVFIGVLNMIYVLVMLVLYVCFPDRYSQQDQAPKWDFGIMAFWTIVWFIASVTWAAGQTKLVEYSSPRRLFFELHECMKTEGHPDNCKSLGAPGFATLAISVICGFLSSCLSGVTMWFIWKETTWARSRQYTSDLNDHTADGSPF